MASLFPSALDLEPLPLKPEKTNSKQPKEAISKSNLHSELTNIFIQKGRMIKILRGTSIKDEFIVDHEYKGHTL